jgi:hypothetical protein
LLVERLQKGEVRLLADGSLKSNFPSKSPPTSAARLLGNVRVQARIAEIMRAGAERAEVTVEQVVRELKLIGFSDIRKVVTSKFRRTCNLHACGLGVACRELRAIDPDREGRGTASP